MRNGFNFHKIHVVKFEVKATDSVELCKVKSGTDQMTFTDKCVQLLNRWMGTFPLDELLDTHTISYCKEEKEFGV